MVGQRGKIGQDAVGEYHIQIANLFMGNVIAQGDGHPGISGQKLVLGRGAVQHKRIVIPYSLSRFDGLSLDVLLFSVYDDGHEDKAQRNNGNGDDSSIV